jgi:hypothetical protein
MSEEENTDPLLDERSDGDLELKEDDAARVAGGRKAGETPKEYIPLPPTPTS